MENKIYKCNSCGNIIELIHEGEGQLVCCGKPMELLKEKTLDVGKEKHVPVIEISQKVIKIKVGSIPHPMEENHYIEWIELISDEVYRKKLNPNEKPEADFNINADKIHGKIYARAYCNIHGLWSS